MEDSTMKKKTYQKPTVQVIIMKQKSSLLAGSGNDPLRAPAPYWDGEGD